MASPELSRDFVRKLLTKSLPTDVDLDSFILDFFPDVHQRFTIGMQRNQKVSLLFESEINCDRIVERLHERVASSVALLDNGRSRSQQAPSSKILIGIAVVSLMLTGVSLALLQQARSRPPAPLVAAPTAPVPVPSKKEPVPPPAPIFLGPIDGNVIVNSPGGKIHNQNSGTLRLRKKPPQKKPSDDSATLDP